MTDGQHQFDRNPVLLVAEKRDHEQEHCLLKMGANHASKPANVQP